MCIIHIHRTNSKYSIHTTHTTDTTHTIHTIHTIYTKLILYTYWFKNDNESEEIGYLTLVIFYSSTTVSGITYLIIDIFRIY